MEFPHVPRMEFEAGFLLMADRRDVWRPDEFEVYMRVAQKTLEILVRQKKQQQS